MGTKLRQKCTRVTAAAATSAGLIAAFGTDVHATAAPLPADPTGGQLNVVGNAGRTWITTLGIPAYIAVVAFMAMVGVGLAWLRKIRKALKSA